VGQHRSASGSALLGLDGFAVLAAEVVGGEWQLDVDTMATVVGCRVVGCGPRSTAAARSGSATCHRRAAGGAVVAQADLALSRRGLSGADLDRASRRDRSRAVLTERARAEACRRVGRTPTRSPRSPVTSGSAGRPSCRRWLIMAGRWGRTRTPATGGRARAGRDQLPQGDPGRAHPVGHRPGRPGARPAAGGGGRPHQGRGGRLARCPVPRLAGPGRHGRAGPWRGYASALTAPSATRPWWWTTFRPSGWPTRWSTRLHGGPSRPPSGIGVANATAVPHPQAAADSPRTAHRAGTSAATGWAGRR